MLIVISEEIICTVNFLSKHRGHSERTRWGGSCNNLNGVFTIAHVFLTLKQNNSDGVD